VTINSIITDVGSGIGWGVVGLVLLQVATVVGLEPEPVLEMQLLS